MKNGVFVDQFGIHYCYKNDKFHREDGPAVYSAISDYKSWWINGKRHREDGPAIEEVNGQKEWWYNGNRINCSSTEEFVLYLRKQKLKSFW